MKNLAGTETEKNLYKTFAGESRARNKYNLFQEKAKEEGYYWIGEVFNETAGNEYAHAREVYKRFLGNVKDTQENLMVSAMGEADEAKNIYKEFEETARSEGFTEIADFYKELREVEEAHKERFLYLYEKLKTNTLYSSSESKTWVCLNCGYIHEGTKAPERCPLCNFPQGYFSEKCLKVK